MRQFVVTLLFTFLFFFAIAQKNKPIYVSTWVNKPLVQDFSKPLIFVDFWATWCGPCISSMPHTESLSEEFKKDILFFFVSDEPSGKVSKFMKKRNKKFFSAVDTTKNNINNFKVSALPHSILIDSQGNVIWKGKPTEMSKKLLKKFVLLYKGDKGKKNRVIELKTSNNEVKSDTFFWKSKPLLYLEKENTANEFSHNNNEFYISGDLEYIVSVMKDVSDEQIISKLSSERKFMITFSSDKVKDFKRALKAFVSKKCKIQIEREKEKKTVFLLEETTNDNFYNASMYNFEKGNDVYLAGDMAVMIDNATIKDAAKILSKFSENIYIYEGKNKNLYDWNLHYKFAEHTLKQLDDLGFIINEKYKKLDFYYLYEDN